MISIISMFSMKITSIWILIASLNRIGPAEAVDLHQKPFVSVKSGEAVTLHCTFEEHMSKEQLVWYKHKLGQSLQLVGTVLGSVFIQPEFQRLGIKLEANGSSISLMIPRTTKNDEGTYFCGKYQGTMIEYSNGTFLAVTGHPQFNISVLQTPVLGSVSPGESVTLQCTVLSEIRAAELRVLWFRAAAEQSFPEIIYTHQNSSSRQCEISSSTHSSVYNFSKNILNQHHTGTYYCAVAACGKIIFGNGSSVELNPTHHQTTTTVSMGLALAVSLFLNIVLLTCGWSGKTSQSMNQNFLEVLQDQDSPAEEFSFFASKRRLIKENVLTRVRFCPVSYYRPVQKDNFAEKVRK